jgi:hypothetical protein
MQYLFSFKTTYSLIGLYLMDFPTWLSNDVGVPIEIVCSTDADHFKQFAAYLIS